MFARDNYRYKVHSAFLKSEAGSFGRWGNGVGAGRGKLCVCVKGGVGMQDQDIHHFTAEQIEQKRRFPLLLCILRRLG